MPELLPFRALRYNASAVADMSAVLCPPFDVISEDERRRLAQLDTRNAVHVELPAPDVESSRRAYNDAARTFAGWQADGTLTRDERPMIYVYEQRYRASDGSDLACRGFFCRLTLEPYGPRSGVRPHEQTLSAAKEDRYRLMSAVGANLSPVLFLYDNGDGGSRSSELIDELTHSAPEVDATGPGGLPNRLWLADPERNGAARGLLQLAAKQPVTIADGHHRYETALRFRDDFPDVRGARHVLALMFDAQSGGLALQPWHRVLRLSGTGPAWLSAAEDWFRITPCASADGVRRDVEGARHLGAGVFGLWSRGGGGILEVDRSKVGQLLSGGGSETLRWLDVSVLSATLSRMIGAPTEQLAADGRLGYVADAAQAIAEVDSGGADAAFVLRATPVEDVLAVAAAGEHMPAKSTLFYPKAATGLVFNPLAD